MGEPGRAGFAQRNRPFVFVAPCFTRDLDPIGGVSCGRYVLPADRFHAALEQLANWPA